MPPKGRVNRKSTRTTTRKVSTKEPKVKMTRLSDEFVKENTSPSLVEEDEHSGRTVEMHSGPSDEVHPERTEARTESDSDSENEDDYEQRRLKNIQDNANFLQLLGIQKAREQMQTPQGKSTQKVKRGLPSEKKVREVLPRRASMRLRRITPEGSQLPEIIPEPERVYTCSICEKSYCKKYLKTHVRTHYGVYRYNCPMCACGFLIGRQMRHHMSKMHDMLKDLPVYDYPCGKCKCHFANIEALKKHGCLWEHEEAVVKIVRSANANNSADSVLLGLNNQSTNSHLKTIRECSVMLFMQSTN